MLVHCPRCRSRFQVPNEAAGKTATCANPQCRTKFVIPAAAAPSDTPGLSNSGGGMVPRQSATGITNPDPTEITIQLATKPKRPSSVTIHTAHPSNSMGIVSLVVGVLALLLCWLPMMNRLGYAIGALGVVLGLFGLLVASQQRGVSIGFPLGGLGLSIVGLVLAFQIDNGFQKMKTAVKTALSDVEKDAGAGKPSGSREAPGQSAKGEPKRWADATKMILTRGDASMKVKGVRLGNTTRLGINGKQEVGPYLLIELRVTNRSETRKLDFKGWSNGLDFIGPKCTLVDEHGNDYAHMRAGIGETWEGAISRETIAPRGTMIDLLSFEPPVNAAKELHLEIPAAPLGLEGWYRFSIPRQMWAEDAKSQE